MYKSQNACRLTEPTKSGTGAFAFSKRTALAASIMLAGTSASTLQSCSGKIAGDERANWVPAYTFDATGAEVAVSPRFAGMDTTDLYGVSVYYGRFTDVPPQFSERESRLTQLVFRQLAETFDFSSSSASSMLGNDVLVFMTDPNAWPNAVFAKDLPAVYEFQVLDSNGHTVSDCRKGPCVIRDLIAINNKDSFFPEAGSIDALTPPQMVALKGIAESVGEELLHDYWLDALDSYARAGFIVDFKEIWRAGSSGQEDDVILAEAWKTGGTAFALTPEGQILSYSLRSHVLEAIATACPTCTQEGLTQMEIAVATYLQLFGDQADSLVGNSPRSYLEYYAKRDKAEGKPVGTYDYYMNLFIERESFSHLGKTGSARRTAPSFFRPLFEPFCKKAHLDTIFSDGYASPAISGNPYLSDFDLYLQLIKSVMPYVVEKAKGG
ncbi:MAG: hypothetical protein V1861_04690 [Candidatus Micrarchaeota archaeon]